MFPNSSKSIGPDWYPISNRNQGKVGSCRPVHGLQDTFPWKKRLEAGPGSIFRGFCLEIGGWCMMFYIKKNPCTYERCNAYAYEDSAMQTSQKLNIQDIKTRLERNREFKHAY